MPNQNSRPSPKRTAPTDPREFVEGEDVEIVRVHGGATGTPLVPIAPAISAPPVGHGQRQGQGQQIEIDLSAIPPMRTFATPSGVMGRQYRKAENNLYLKNLTDGESKGLVNKHVAITKLTDIQIHDLVNSESHGYEGSVSEFIRHAIELLIMYYIETGQYPPENIGFASDIMRQQHSLRLDMEREKLRLELITAIKVFDKAMEFARRTNDMVYVADRLTKYKDMLDNCPSEAQRQQVRGVLLESVATRSAVQAFNKWTHNRYRVDVGEWKDEWKDLSEQWAQWFDDEMSNPT